MKNRILEFLISTAFFVVFALSYLLYHAIRYGEMPETQ